jgi:carbamoyltransferase
MKKILGIQKDHNASACLFFDDELVYYNQEERLSRIKGDSGLPVKTLQEICKISSEIDVLLITGYDTSFNDSVSIMSILKKLGFTGSRNFEFVPYYKSHHLMHASRAFYNSSLSNALVIVCDGKGSSYNLNNGGIANETTSVFSASYPNKFDLIYRRLFTNSQPTDDCSVIWNIDVSTSFIQIPEYVNKKTIVEIRNDFDLGFMYEGTSRSMGFNDEGGKMMGLQSYGEPRDDLPEVFDENFYFNMNVFKFDELYHHKDFNKLAYPQFHSHKEQADFAFKVQKAFETAGLKLIKEMLELTGHKNLILTGGTALNVVANNFYRKHLPDDINLHIEAHCGDEGNCIGVCQYFYNSRYKSTEPKNPLSIYMCGNEPLYEYNLLEHEVEINDVDEDIISNILKAGHIVGLFQGKAEAGPRALGNRSLLFDPRVLNGKDIVNLVKGREQFRPFAAAVMKEHTEDWFVLEKITESPHMMYAVDVKENKLTIIPGVIHVDNTCRIQTVSKEQNLNLYNIINSFYQETGIPMLLNTSFNLAGDPIVETINDAIASLRRSRLEYLYLPDIKKLIYIKN